jgi:hypothetical protein
MEKRGIAIKVNEFYNSQGQPASKELNCYDSLG